MTAEDIQYYYRQLKSPFSIFSFIIGFVLALALAGVLYVYSEKAQDKIACAPCPPREIVINQDEEIDPNIPLPVVYEVRKGDSLWKIAEIFYGDGSKYLQIAADNGLIDDMSLEIGQRLTINPLKVTVDQDQDVSDETNLEEDQYQVVKGDSLWHISLKYLGDAVRWRDIYDMNKTTIGSNPDLIYPGQVFYLPRE